MASHAPLDPEFLSEIAAGLARSGLQRTPLTGAGDRRYARLLDAGAYDVWLIEWDPVSDLDLHDHGGSSGAFQVIMGLLVEEHADLSRPAPLRQVHVCAGGSRSIPPSRVHRVWNPGPTRALSIHVYSPPLSSMTFYSGEPDGYLQPVTTRPVLGAAPEPAGVR